MLDKPARIYKATGTVHTLKQEAFIREVVKSKNGTEAVQRVYNVKNPAVARAIASQNFSKPSVRASIQEHLEASGYNPTDSIISLRANEQAGQGVRASASDSIRASELLLKLSGMVVDRHTSVNLNMDVSTLPKDKLFKLKDDFDKLLNDK